MDNLTKKLLAKLKIRVDNFIPDSQYPHDPFIIIVLKEAIKAAKEGNFGIGAVLVGKNGKIIERGRNHVFNPYFRSDLHAEMDVMTKFEKYYKSIKNLKRFVLYTSLEPCPMCLARLICSGIKKVYYAAPDREGGMVHKLKSLPSIWVKLAAKRKFIPAQCSPELRNIAFQIFLTTADENNKKLQNR